MVTYNEIQFWFVVLYLEKNVYTYLGVTCKNIKMKHFIDKSCRILEYNLCDAFFNTYS